MARYLWWAVLIAGIAWAAWMLVRIFRKGAVAIVDPKSGEVVGARLEGAGALKYRDVQDTYVDPPDLIEGG